MSPFWGIVRNVQTRPVAGALDSHLPFPCGKSLDTHHWIPHVRNRRHAGYGSHRRPVSNLPFRALRTRRSFDYGLAGAPPRALRSTTRRLHRMNRSSRSARTTLASRISARAARLTVLLGVMCAFMALGAPSALATNPDHVNFTLEGCRLVTTGSLPNGSGDFVCDDSEYTTGNLGKNWNELDLVPYRLTADNNNGAQTYTVAIAVDYFDAGHPGYDALSVPVLNTDLSSATGCDIVASAEKHMTPGLGGMDDTLY